MQFHSAAALADLYRRRALSPSEVIEGVLDRAATVQARLNPFVLIDAERARAAAAASTRRWLDGAPLSRLDGVPLAVKDNHALAGQVRTMGSRGRLGAAPDTESAPHVARLLEAGAVPFARTAMPDLGWKGVNDSPLHGVTRNPWNPALTPGGSSGGSAVAVATGCCPIATGSDGGGSIRIPAAFTGVFGIKPTTFRVPGLHDSPAGDLVAAGPLATSVADAALALSVMCRRDPRDPIAAALVLGDLVAETGLGVAGLRIAVSPTLGFAAIATERLDALKRAAAVLEAAGAIVTWEDPPAWDFRDGFAAIWESAYASVLMDMTRDAAALLDPGLRQAASRGLALSAAAEKRHQAERTRLMHAFIGFFRRHDVLLTPAMPIAPFTAGHGMNAPDPNRYPAWYDWTPFTWPFNATRMPAASCPCGLDTAGLPHAVQVVATHFREDLVLRVSAVLETAWPFKAPPDSAWAGAEPQPAAPTPA